MSNMQEWSEKQLDDQLKEGERAFIFFHTPFLRDMSAGKKNVNRSRSDAARCDHRNE